ncbi:MAG: RDD family protein [Gammaproteobacteria bacterium]
MQHQTPTTRSQPLTAAAGFFRRLAAIVYDSLLLAAILFAATAVVLPLNHGEAFSSDNYFYLAYLFFVGFLFYGWFWTHGGQTLGMKAWKIRVMSKEGSPINWLQALIRYVTAFSSLLFFGLGFFWIILDKHKRGWHDHLSGTVVCVDRST